MLTYCVLVPMKIQCYDAWTSRGREGSYRMKKLIILAIAALAFGTLAKADGLKLDDDDARALQSFRLMNAHHAHGLHLKFKKDDNDAGIDLDDFIWTGPSKSKSVQLKSELLNTRSDSKSTEDGIIATSQDNNGGDGDPATPPSTVPEPGTLVLLGTGLLMGAAAVRKQMRITQ